MTLEIFLAALRHLMTAAGVYLIPLGIADADGWTAFSGAVVTVVGFGWSVYRKWERRDA